MNQDPCSLSLDDHLDGVMEHLPRGAAWTRDEESVSRSFWRPFAEMVKFAEDRLCALTAEFFCSTAVETIDQWAEVYGVAAPENIDYESPCLKPEYLEYPLSQQVTLAPEVVCAKVIAQGGSTCEYFSSVAASANWIMTCADAGIVPHPITGCAYAGNISMGPMFDLTGLSALNFGALSLCDFGPAIDHPEPRFWDRDSNRSHVSCLVPGSLLGQPACCTATGFYDFTDQRFAYRSNACLDDASVAPYRQDAKELLYLVPKDTSNSFLEYTGHAHTLRLEVDVKATLAAKDAASPYQRLWSMTGCVYCGEPCAPVRNLQTDELVDILEGIVPAHLDLKVVFV